MNGFILRSMLLGVLLWALMIGFACYLAKGQTVELHATPTPSAKGAIGAGQSAAAFLGQPLTERNGVVTNPKEFNTAKHYVFSNPEAIIHSHFQPIVEKKGSEWVITFRK